MRTRLPKFHPKELARRVCRRASLDLSESFAQPSLFVKQQVRQALAHRARLIDLGGSGERINLFIHGYKSLETEAQVERTSRRIRALAIPGHNYLLQWSSGKWRDSALAGALTASYRVARFRHLLAPWMVLVDAGVLTISEVAQFKWMEQRARFVGRDLESLVDSIDGARGRPINLIGHSLGARVIHHALAAGSWRDHTLQDGVMLGGAADLDSPDWLDCVAKLHGQLFNGHSKKDRILAIAPDFRRRVGSAPLPFVEIGGKAKVVNHHCQGIRHVEYWTRLERVLPVVWSRCYSAAIVR